jgi:hypothetical protein
MKASFGFSYVSQDLIILRDNNIGMSITNDAEAVVKNVLAQCGREARIFYIDSQGQYDELVHNGRSFVVFHVHGSKCEKSVIDLVRAHATWMEFIWRVCVVQLQETTVGPIPERPNMREKISVLGFDSLDCAEIGIEIEGHAKKIYGEKVCLNFTQKITFYDLITMIERCAGASFSQESHVKMVL